MNNVEKVNSIGANIWAFLYNPTSHNHLNKSWSLTDKHFYQNLTFFLFD